MKMSVDETLAVVNVLALKNIANSEVLIYIYVI